MHFFKKYIFIFFCIQSFLGLVFFFFFKEEKEAVKEYIFPEKKIKKIHFSNILSGPLDIKEKKIILKTPNILEKMKIYFHEKRPDTENPFLEIFLKEKKIVPFQQKVYLTKELDFSKAPTNFWILFFQKEQNIVMRMSMEGKKKAYPVHLSKYVMEDKAYNILKNFQWIGTDLFLEKYFTQSLYMFSCGQNFFSLNKEDLLVWDGNWRKKKPLEDVSKYPIAKIFSCDEKKITLQFWTKDKQEAKLFLSKSFFNRGLVFTDNYITNISMRTNTKVGFSIENQRVLLKEKDLLYKEQGRWRKESLERFQKKKIVPEIFFILESLKKEDKKIFFKGHFFNKQRNQIQPIEKIIFQTKKR